MTPEKPPPEIADAFNRGDFSAVATWIRKEGDQRVRVAGREDPPTTPPRAPPPSPAVEDAIEKLKDYLTDTSVADWILSALVAVFMSFILGVLTWKYDGPGFRYPYGALSLLGVWLLCYWSVLLARKLWKAGKPSN